MTRLLHTVVAALAFLVAATFAATTAISAPAKAPAPAAKPVAKQTAKPATRAAAAGKPGAVEFVRPELPREQVDTKMPRQRGRVMPVPAQADLQAALNDAKPGDTLVLDAGAVYSGGFVLPKKSGDGWIIVRSTAESQLPPAGTRVAPDKHARHMPRLVTPNNNTPALRTEPGAHHWRFIGVEFAADPKVKRVSAIVELSHNASGKL